MYRWAQVNNENMFRACLVVTVTVTSTRTLTMAFLNVSIFKEKKELLSIKIDVSSTEKLTPNFFIYLHMHIILKITQSCRRIHPNHSFNLPCLFLSLFLLRFLSLLSISFLVDEWRMQEVLTRSLTSGCVVGGSHATVPYVALCYVSSQRECTLRGRERERERERER